MKFWFQLVKRGLTFLSEEPQSFNVGYIEANEAYEIIFSECKHVQSQKRLYNH